MKTILFILLAATILLFAVRVLHAGEPAVSAQAIRVACVGDSITKGSAGSGYPAYLQTMLGANYFVGNFGVMGSAVTLNSDKPYVNQREFLMAKEFKPDIVVIMLGTNDARTNNYPNIEDFQDNYERLIAEFQALRTQPEVWLVEPPPIYNNTLNLKETNLEQGVLPNIEQTSIDLHLPIINVYAALANHSEYFMDGVHPSSEGAELIANEVYGAFVNSTDATP